MKSLILYFSGTGNSYYVAKGLHTLLESSDITNILQLRNYDLREYKTIILISPVYYNHLPNICRKVIGDLESKHFNKFVMIATYSGNTGYVFSDFEDYINDKNSLILNYRVKMPGNYLLEYGAFPNWYIEWLIRKANKQIINISKSIVLGDAQKSIKPNVMAKIFKKHAYKKISEFHKVGSCFSVNDNCVHCGQCIKQCPVNNIKLTNGSLMWSEKCEQCMACVQFCLKNAIQHDCYKKKRKRYTNPYIDINELGGKDEREESEQEKNECYYNHNAFGRRNGTCL